MNSIIYRCPKKCPVNKKCFLLKVSKPINQPIEILQKCPAMHGKDICIILSKESQPNGFKK
jgi:hypothetical protein